ncbi:MAG: hypothetical protein ACODAC_10715 [Pseudomonadota bacterium]
MRESTATTFDILKAKQREISDGFPDDLALRVHRALSWLHRAELAEDDFDAAFIFYWIAFNAAYARELDDTGPNDERATLRDYFRTLTALDRGGTVYDTIWERYPHAIRGLLHNRYVFQPFWKHQNGAPGYGNWERAFASSRRRIASALGNRDTETILTTLFDRLYVLRNQLVHGGATWNSQVNRDQVRDGARIMALLVPRFIDLMMDHPEVAWGAPYYPVVD